MNPDVLVQMKMTRSQFLKWLASTTGLLWAGGFREAEGSHAASEKPDWTKLQNKLQGTVVPRGSAAYDGDRSALIWNARKPERFPEAIAHVVSESDIANAVRFARDQGIRVAIRGGGHHFNGPAVRQGGLLLDLGGLKEIRIDTPKKLAVVQPGVTSREFLDALIPHGLAFPVGHCSSVPLSGFLLNGGFGWNSGSWGPACFSIQGVEVVTSSGKSIYADAERNAEYYWAARGAGLGFPGVVSRYHLRVHPLPKVIRTSTLMFNVDDLDEAATWLASAQAMLPPPVELSALVVSPPPEAQQKGAPPRIFLVIATAFADTEEDAEKWLAPFARGPVVPAAIGAVPFVETPFEALFASIDAAFPVDHRYAADHVWTNAAPKDLLASVRDNVLSPPSPRNFLMLAFGPNLAKDAPPPPDMALSSLGKIYAGIYGVWTDPAGDTNNCTWVRSMSEALDSNKAGRYIGDADIEAGPEHLKQCFSLPAWNRLVALRKKVDPEGVFFSFLEPNSTKN